VGWGGGEGRGGGHEVGRLLPPPEIVGPLAPTAVVIERYEKREEWYFCFMYDCFMYDKLATIDGWIDGWMNGWMDRWMD
jgi:hypothetical protein